MTRERALIRRIAAGVGIALACGILWAAAFWQPLPRACPEDAVGEQASVDAGLSESAAASELRREHLALVRASPWHAKGWRGQGVKVAVLDSGFRGYRTFLGKGLPASVRTRSFRGDGDLEARNSQHGILCAEVIHALAPDAEVLLANWEPDDPQAFLAAVAWARDQGARIVSCSLIMPGWSDGHGGGAVHRDLEKRVGSGDDRRDLMFCACAGNTAQRHWSGTLEIDEGGWHRWSKTAIANRMKPWGAERVAVEVYGPSLPRGLLQVCRGDGAVVGEVKTGWSGSAAVRFDPQDGETYELRLHSCEPGDDAVRFHIVVLGGDLAHTCAADSIAFPGDGRVVATVAAVDRAGRRKDYSSCGPSSTRAKPDFAAQVPFPSLCRAQPFSGTSAAAPQLAGLAALLLSRHPTWTPRQVHAFLHAEALDLAAPGHDCETGFGLARLPERE